MRVLTLVTIITVVAGSASAAWIIEIVDPSYNSGYNASMRLDSAGYLHIVYRCEPDNDLSHAFQNASGWQFEVIDDCDCRFMGLAIDSLDLPTVSFWDNTDSTICVVRWNSGSWEKDVLAIAKPIPSQGHWPSTDIEIDSLGRIHVIWYDATDTALHYAVRDTTGTWDLMVVDSYGNTGTDASLAIASGLYPKVSYINETEGTIWYASLYGASWYTQEVDSVCQDASATSISLDQTGNPSILYRCYDDYYLINLATKSGMEWDIETIRSSSTNYYCPGSPQGLVIDSDTQPHVIVRHNILGFPCPELLYYYKVGSNWTYEFVDGDYAGWYASLCMDASGNPNIAYFHSYNLHLRRAQRDPTGIWSTQESLAGGCVSIHPVQNPVSDHPVVSLQVQEATEISISVYDIAGRLIQDISSSWYPPGAHTLQLDDYQPGLYFCLAETDEFRASTHLTVTR